MKKFLVLGAIVAALVVPQVASADFVTVQSVKNPVHHGWNNSLVLCADDDVFLQFCVPLGLNWFSNTFVAFEPIVFVDGTQFIFFNGQLLPLIG